MFWDNSYGDWEDYLIEEPRVNFQNGTRIPDPEELQKAFGADYYTGPLVELHPVVPRIDVEPPKTCQHEYVNVGFNSLKMVCKHCDKEK